MMMKRIGYCLFFRLTCMRVPDLLYFIIGGRPPRTWWEVTVFSKNHLSWICITKQTVMIAWVQVIRPDIHWNHTSAPLWWPLACIPFKAEVSTKYFNKKIIWNTRTSPDVRAWRKRIQHFLFAAHIKINFFFWKFFFHFKKNFYFFRQDWIDKRKSWYWLYAFFYLGVMIHEAGNTPCNTALWCPYGNPGKIMKIVFNYVLFKFKEANGIESPVYGFWIVVSAKVSKLNKSSF